VRRGHIQLIDREYCDRASCFRAHCTPAPKNNNPARPLGGLASVGWQCYGPAARNGASSRTNAIRPS
jgi:hypothetical protein